MRFEVRKSKINGSSPPLIIQQEVMTQSIIPPKKPLLSLMGRNLPKNINRYDCNISLYYFLW